VARRSRVEGPNALRRKLRRVEPAITKSLRSAIQDGANRIAHTAAALAPADTGELRMSIQTKVSSDGLTAIIGPGARAAEILRSKTGSSFGTKSKRGKSAGKKVSLSRLNKRLLMSFYKAYWIEYGTKGAPKRNIPPQPARPFMTPAFDINKSYISNKVKAAINSILEQASNGRSV
jgi:HK97 gp10 family phage protein